MRALLARLLLKEDRVLQYAPVIINGDIRQRMYLDVNGQLIDVSIRQYLFCLEPVVFGIWMDENTWLFSHRTYQLYFVADGAKNIRKEAVARVEVEMTDQIDEAGHRLMLLKYVNSAIKHVNLLKRFFIFWFFYKKPDAIPGQMLAFTAAYSYPRRVRLVSFRQGNYYNLFPMDLLGDISADKRFAFGLRNANVVLEKIKQEKRIVVCEAEGSYKQLIYQMGAHHSSTPPPVDELPFRVSRSEKFGFYVPDWVCSYKEVMVTKVINLGSHSLLWGEVVNAADVKQPCNAALYHIHYLLHLYLKAAGRAYPIV